ncbi:MAG: vWA domain-containing protein [Planctomycetota bacterium]
MIAQLAAWFWSGGELWRPEALLALPLLLLAWWLRRQRSQEREVATTFIWQRVVSGAGAHAVSGRLLAFIILSALALTTPMAWEPPPAQSELPRIWLRPPTAPGAGCTLEVILPAGRDNARIETTRTANVSLREDRPTAWATSIDPATRQMSVTVRIGDQVQRAQFGALPRYAPIAVRDNSNVPAVGAALSALATQSLIVATAPDAPSDVVIMMAAAEEASPGARIVFAAGGNGVLPSPTPRHPLLAGLQSRTWNIVQCQPGALPGWPVEEILLDSDLGPLLYRSGDAYVFSFTPEDSDLAERAVWPVLLGRLLERCAATPPTILPDTSKPSAWPTRVLLAGALLLAWGLGLRRRRAWLVTLCLVVAAWCAPGIGSLGSPRRATIATDTPTTAAQLLTEVRSLGVGGTLRITQPGPAPIATEQWRQLLQLRGVTIELPTGAPTLLTSSRRVVVATPVELSSVAASPDAVVTAIGPVSAASTDSRRELQRIPGATARWRHEPDTPGIWHYELSAGGVVQARSSIVVTPPLELLLLSGETTAGFDDVGTASEFRQRHYTAARDSLRLPTTDGGIVVWNGLDPARVPSDERARLADWVHAGGTLLSAVGPPFFADTPAAADWNALLPAPLPTTPQRPEVAFGIILLDLSGSLRGSPLAELTTAVGGLLRSTPDGGRWGVAYFRDQPGWLAAPGTPVDAALVERVSGLAVGGGTRLDRALPFVLQQLANVAAGRALVVLTDGQVTLPAPRAAGRQLAQADVELLVVAFGAAPNTKLLQEFVAGASGSYEYAPTGAAAARVLSNALLQQPQSQRATQGPLRHATLTPILNGVAASVPAPRQHHVLTEQAPDARPLLVAADGTPLLLHRPVGRGHTLLWCASLEASNLASGTSTRHLHSALLSTAINCVRGAPTAFREARVAGDRTGQLWVSWPRNPRGEAVQEVSVGMRGDDAARLATALSAEQIGLPLQDLEQDSLRAVRFNGEEVPVSRSIDRGWNALVDQGRTARAPQLPIDVLATVVAILLTLSSGRPRRPHAAAP